VLGYEPRVERLQVHPTACAGLPHPECPIASAHGSAANAFERGKPVENARSSRGPADPLRDWFETTDDTIRIIEACPLDWNQAWPHSSLADLTLKEFSRQVA